MTDPILPGYLANLGSDLTGSVLGVLGRKANEFALGTPRYQALKRCYAAAEAVLLPPNDPLTETYRPHLAEFLADRVVASEFSKLVKGRSPDLKTIAEALAEFAVERGLPTLDLADRLNAAVRAFLEVAEQEPELQGTIQTAQLRDLVGAVERLPERLEALVQQVVEASRPGRGDVRVTGDLTVHGDLVTGIQIINHPPPPPPPDPCENLGGRYLAGLLKEVVALPLAALEDEGADSRRAPITLDRVYIALNTQSRVKLTQAEKERAEFRSGDERPLTALEAAAQQPRLALLGDPGSGKSVFVNHLAYLLARTHLYGEALPAGWNGPPQWPVRFILRDLAARLDPAELGKLTPTRQKQSLLAAARAYLLEQFVALNLSPDEAEQWHTCLHGRPGLLIFDGLDEVPLAQLSWVRQSIELLAARHEGPAIVTCRIRSYQSMAPLPGFAAETLAPFDTRQMDAFINHWYQAQPGLTPAQRAGRVADLGQAVRNISELAQNPLLLTTMALIHTAGVGLPKERVKLYGRSVEVLMRRWQRHKYGQASLLEQLGVDSTRLLHGLRALAFEAHQSVPLGQPADLDGDRVVGILDRVALKDIAKAKLFLAYIDQQAGLLWGRGGSETTPPVYTFAHRTFQEYLAGCYLALNQREGLARAVRARLAEGERWYLVSLLAAEHLLYEVGQEHTVLDLLYKLCPVSQPNNEAAWRGVAWAGVMAAEMGADRIECDDAGDGGRCFIERLLPRLETIVGQGMLTVAERADAGDALSILNGDTRPGIGLLPPPLRGRVGEGVEIPHLELCYIPPGPFWLGSRKGEDDLALDGEYGHDRPFDLTYPYWVSRYPLTQAQYHAFVRATGHRVPYREEEWALPYNWSNGAPPPHRHNHSVVLVSWHDAMTCCAWLTEQYRAWLPPGYAIRLPTEAEWEKAARGGLEIPVKSELISLTAALPPLPVAMPSLQPNPNPKRHWPWGEWAEDSPQYHANTIESGRGQTMATGSFPAGVSPYGCLDMVGNVSEWTLSKFKRYPYRDDGRNDLAGEGNRSVRGGFWFIEQRNARVSYRYFNPPDDFFDNYGFRVSVAPVFA